MPIDRPSNSADSMRVKQQAFEFYRDWKRMEGMRDGDIDALRMKFFAQARPLLDQHQSDPVEAERGYREAIGEGDVALYFATLQFLATHFDQVAVTCTSYEELRVAGVEVDSTSIIANLGESV